MSVQSLQSWKSWKSRLRLVEIDTVDFLFGRLIYTCICTGENSEFTPPCGILGSCPMKKSSRCRSTFCRNPPQILQIGIFGLILFHLSWDKKFHRLFLFRFYNLSTFHFYFLIFIYLTFLENGGMLLSLFYWNEKYLWAISLIISEERWAKLFIHITSFMIPLLYFTIVRILKKLVSIPLDKRKCSVYAGRRETF